MTHGPDPKEVILSDAEAVALTALVKRHNTPQQIAMRARIIQAAEAGMNNQQIGRELGLCVNTVRLWRKRWLEWQAIPLEEVGVEARLSDEPRSGNPGKFSAEQVAQIIAIACEEPQGSGYPVSHWTPKELVLEAVKRGVVKSISERQVGRFLKRGGLETASQSLLAQHDRKRPAGVPRTGS
jgi:putative transposase